MQGHVDTVVKQSMGNVPNQLFISDSNVGSWSQWTHADRKIFPIATK